MADEDDDFSLGENINVVKPCHMMYGMNFNYARETPRSYYSNEIHFRREHAKLSQSSSIESDRISEPEKDTFRPNINRPRLESQSSIVDGLLFEIYDRWHDNRLDSFDSDTFTECSSTSEFMHGRRSSFFHGISVGGHQMHSLHRGLLEEQTAGQLYNMISELKRGISQTSAKLVKQLKRRERRLAKQKTNCDIVTAIIQASSPKRRIDTRMRFSVEPPPGESAFDQWKDAMKAVARLPLGIPDEFRKKVWLYLADNYVKEIKIDWEKTVKFAFNERSNPDDNKLGLQIVKDLHRTGCSGFSGEENEDERASLKRILLAYARWNKAVGYCQGFNVIAALLLDVLDRKEDDAFKVMIYLIDCVLPQSYFANNLRALSVDMAVFRDLLKIFPKLSKHLDYLQHAQDQASGGCYEPPLTNVFTMQWFLTLFATCLPKSTVLRVWDSIMLEGSEILLRTALTIWGKLSSRLLTVNSADEFYTLMGDLTNEMLQGNILDADSMIKHIYTLAPFPFPQLNELREKYTYNIRPFTPNGTSKKSSWFDGAVLPSDEDDLDDEDIEAITCFTGFIPTATSGMRNKAVEGDQRTGSVPDFSSLGPGAYGQGSADNLGIPGIPAYMERMSTDIGALQKQYAKLKQRQRQAHIILSTASAKQYAAKTKPIVPKLELPTAVNHLFLARQGTHGKNRYVAAGPRIANMYPVTRPAAMEKTSKSVQPVTPQVTVGDTKCKWVQKKKKEIDKGSDAKVTKNASSPKKDEMKRETSGKEAEINLNAGLEQESVDVSNKTVERNNNNSSLEFKQVGDNNMNDDSGLGTSIHTPENSDSADALSTEDNVVRTGGIDSGSDSLKEDSVFEKSLIETVSATQGKLTVLKEADNGNDGDDSSGYDENLRNDENQIRISAYLRERSSLDTVTVTDSECNCTHGESNDLEHSSAEKTLESGCDNCRKCHQPVVNGDVVNRSHKDKLEPKISKRGTEAAIKCKSGVEGIETTHSSNSNLARENHQGFNNDYEMNINNNCASKDGSKPKIALSNQPNSEKDLNCSKSASVSVNQPKEHIVNNLPGSKSDSVNKYYSNKKTLAANSDAFQDHLQTYRHEKKSFNPFPVKHVNTNRARTGIKLGLYKQSTLDEFERNLRKPVWGK